ncbi:hypothetical protein E1295_43370 [Nonomuraea mesophila]|uniref:Uncharacterized protein n=1 Tax=Nonomuraea mesophila TaxID=2530382 RepID=A0A4R5E849_9ACTN|nr:hypothetical protein E1295_43370 [Nonomuraea mesophila]
MIPADRASAADCPYDGYSYWTRCYPNPACGTYGYEKTRRICRCPPGSPCFWEKYPKRQCCS